MGDFVAMLSEHHRRFVVDCCLALSVELVHVLGKRKSRDVNDLVRARKSIPWALRQRFPELSYPDIGGLLKRDHSTIMYSVAAFGEALDNREGWALYAARELLNPVPPVKLELALESLGHG